ncbi:MAG: helix-turn-helix domain-containing protein, partial [Gaiellaceae bacterium]
IALSELGPELARSGRSATVGDPVVADDELLGLLHAEGTSEVDLARAAANQIAVAIKKIELIERLTEKNLIKDFFEQLAGGAVLGAAEGKAARLGCDLDTAHVVLAATPADEVTERALASALSGGLFDRREDSIRGLLPLVSGDPARILEKLQQVVEKLETAPTIGLSNPCKGAATYAAGFEEAEHALLGASVIRGQPGVMSYEELGPYKYLLRMPFDSAVRDAHRDAVARIAEYDRQRSTALLKTLEEFLRRRGNVSATAEALYVHPNTLRQRLRRIVELSGIDLRKDDWLLVELAVKMVRLQEALGRAGSASSDITRPRRV